MTNKPKPVPLAMVICDTVIDDRLTGKKSLIGLFNNINTSVLPCRHPSMTIFCALTDGTGQYQGVLRCQHLASGKMIMELKGPIPFPNPLATVEFHFEVRNIVFPEAGQYIFELQCDDQLVISRKFNVTKMDPPKNQPPPMDKLPGSSEMV
ncbi:MAG: hypothetical protein WC980_05875 [Candidatus Brocadiia bacterium]